MLNDGFPLTRWFPIPATPQEVLVGVACSGVGDAGTPPVYPSGDAVPGGAGSSLRWGPRRARIPGPGRGSVLFVPLHLS